ncbi:MAG TPA: hypothetical protein VJ865_16660, partial [Gemmatimonadaceae bacterium]|nr:hypothetical protein [Gemmatimonadaceae bacterium]
HDGSLWRLLHRAQRIYSARAPCGKPRRGHPRWRRALAQARAAIVVSNNAGPSDVVARHIYATFPTPAESTLSREVDWAASVVVVASAASAAVKTA